MCNVTIRAGKRACGLNATFAEKMKMELRFPIPQFEELSRRYVDEMPARDRQLTETITRAVFASYERKGYLTKDEFLTVCAWKTPRSMPRCEAKDDDFIKEISGIVEKTQSERLRIQAWTLLSGVKWPTASVFLHFGFPDKYPILDFRALWSLTTDVPAQLCAHLDDARRRLRAPAGGVVGPST